MHLLGLLFGVEAVETAPISRPELGGCPSLLLRAAMPPTQEAAPTHLWRPNAVHHAR